MTLPTLYLALDPTGASAANKRENELHTVASRSTRVIKPNFSPYFTASLKVYSVVTVNNAPVKTLLTHGVDYSFVELYERVTRVTGQEVCRAILIHRAELPDDFSLDYQALGGMDNVDYEALAIAVRDLNNDGEPVDWDDILDKPTGFPPGPHLHDSADLYGLEKLADEVQAIVYAASTGSDYSELLLLGEVTKSRRTVLQALQGFWASLENHFQDQTNPHEVTKGQIGLGSVENRHFVPRVVNGTPVEPYASPRTTFNLIKAALLGDIMKHIDDHRNPHQVTKAQVGLGNVPNFPMATPQQMSEGTSEAAFVSPVDVHTVTPSFLGGILAHTQDTENPHEVTQDQVGLDQVANFPIAVETEVLAGVSEERLMVPTQIKAVTDKYRTDSSPERDGHITNTDNPHEVDKDQVGLDQVEDYALALSADVLIGISDNLYVTPQVMKDTFSESYDHLLDVADIDDAGGAVPLDANLTVPARLLQNTPDYRKFSLKHFFKGTPTKDQMLLSHLFGRAVTFPPDFLGSMAAAAVAAVTKPVTVEILKGTTLLGTVVFHTVADVGASEAKQGVILGKGVDVNFAAGEVLSLRVTVAEPAFADIAFHFVGTYDLAASSNPMGGLRSSVTVRPNFMVLSGGRNASNAMVNTRDKYDINSATLFAGSALTDARHYAASYGNSFKGMLAGGRTGLTVIAADVETYAFATDAVTTGGAIGVARYSAIGLGNENVGIVTGGVTGADALSNVTAKQVYASDTSNVISTLGLTMARTNGYGTAANGYIRGGSTLFAEWNGSTYFGKYNYAAGTLSVVSTASTLSRYGAMAAGNTTVGVMAGGSYQGEALTTVQRHVYASDALSAGTALSDGRAFGAGGGDALAGYFSGGARTTGVVVDTATIYTYADDTTATGTVLTAARQNLSALSSSPGWR